MIALLPILGIVLATNVIINSVNSAFTEHNKRMENVIEEISQMDNISDVDKFELIYDIQKNMFIGNRNKNEDKN